MSSQLLGAQASLNAPAGLPGAAPTVLQGALVVNNGTTINGNDNVNGTLTVTQRLGGGVRTAYFTDGGVGAAENSISIFNDQAATSLVFIDSAQTGTLSFEGTAAPGTFLMDRNLNLGANSKVTTSNIVPFTAGSVGIGDVTNPVELRVNVPPTGGGTRAVYITDNQAGVAENSIQIFLNQAGGTSIISRDKQTNGTIRYDGGFLGTTGAFVLDKFTNFSKTNAVSTPQQCGVTQTGGSGFAESIPGLTATGVVIVTKVQGVGTSPGPAPFEVICQPDQFVVVFTGGGTAAFYYFVASLN